MPVAHREKLAGTLYRKLLSFHGGHIDRGAFVNMEGGIAGKVVRHPDFDGYRSDVSWKQLHCPETKRVGPFTIATECNSPDGSHEYSLADPSRYKVFVKLGRRRLRNLADYIHLVQTGVISKEGHTALVEYLQEREADFRSHNASTDVVAFNHNMDVGLLHFKFKCLSSHKCERGATSRTLSASGKRRGKREPRVTAA